MLCDLKKPWHTHVCPLLESRHPACGTYLDWQLWKTGASHFWDGWVSLPGLSLSIRQQDMKWNPLLISAQSITGESGTSHAKELRNDPAT
jgi:hypothetical protein